MQSAIGTALYTAWLGGLPTETHPAELGRLLTIDDMGSIYNGTVSFLNPPHPQLLNSNKANHKNLDGDSIKGFICEETKRKNKDMKC